MLGCHKLFGHERGEEVREYIESLTGGPCPCRRGKVCPLTGRLEVEDGTAATPA
jgi:hypothetical protein